MKKFLLTLSLLLLAGCGLFSKTKPVDAIGEIQRIPVWYTYDCGPEPRIDSPTMLDIFVKVQDGLYTMDGQEYGDSAENMADTIKGMYHQREVIRFYRKCIAKAQQLADKDTDHELSGHLQE